MARQALEACVKKCGFFLHFWLHSSGPVFQKIVRLFVAHTDLVMEHFEKTISDNVKQRLSSMPSHFGLQFLQTCQRAAESKWALAHRALSQAEAHASKVAVCQFKNHSKRFFPHIFIVCLLPKYYKCLPGLEKKIVLTKLFSP